MAPRATPSHVSHDSRATHTTYTVGGGAHNRHGSSEIKVEEPRKSRSHPHAPSSEGNMSAHERGQAARNAAKAAKLRDASTVGPDNSISVASARSNATVTRPPPGGEPFFVPAPSSTGSGRTTGSARPPSTTASPAWPAPRANYPASFGSRSFGSAPGSDLTRTSSGRGGKCDFHRPECVKGTCNHTKYSEYTVFRNGKPVGPSAYTQTEVVRQTAGALDVKIDMTPSPDSPYHDPNFAANGPHGLRRAHSSHSSGPRSSAKSSRPSSSSHDSSGLPVGYLRAPPPPPSHAPSAAHTTFTRRPSKTGTSQRSQPAPAHSSLQGTQYHPRPRNFHIGQPVSEQPSNASSHHNAVAPADDNPYANGSWPKLPKHRALPPPRILDQDGNTIRSAASKNSKSGSDFYNRG